MFLFPFMKIDRMDAQREMTAAIHEVWQSERDERIYAAGNADAMFRLVALTSVSAVTRQTSQRMHAQEGRKIERKAAVEQPSRTMALLRTRDGKKRG